MFYIKTSRGWQPLDKRHYEIAQSWRKAGLDVEEKVASLKVYDHWVSERNYNYMDVMDRLIYSARQRAKKLSIECSISLMDFDIPEVCPLRGVPLKVGSGQHTDDSPSLDRKDPRKGYVKGNVWVISHKANRLKGNFTPNELKAFCENALALNWVTWTSDDEGEAKKQQADWKRKISEKQKPRWWTLWGRVNPK